MADGAKRIVLSAIIVVLGILGVLGLMQPGMARADSAEPSGQTELNWYVSADIQNRTATPAALTLEVGDLGIIRMWNPGGPFEAVNETEMPATYKPLFSRHYVLKGEVHNYIEAIAPGQELYKVYYSVPTSNPYKPELRHFDIAVNVIPVQDASLEKTYRVYNEYTGDHLYTKDATERNTLCNAGWNYEGVGWYGPKTSNTPVYRLLNPSSGDHHFTKDYNEYMTLGGIGWKQEGIAWYSDDAGEKPLYRLFNPNVTIGTHHYTADLNEYNSLAECGWEQEGVAWYSVK